MLIHPTCISLQVHAGDFEPCAREHRYTLIASVYAQNRHRKSIQKHDVIQRRLRSKDQEFTRISREPELIEPRA